MLHVFMDTNAYLSFYRFSNDDLEELRKLQAAVKASGLRLYVTTHLLDEFRRNREGVIAQSLKTLRDSKLPKAFPQMAKNYASYDGLRSALKAYSDALATLMDEIQQNARDNQLHADLIIEELFSSAAVIAVDDTLVARARTRYDLGNPPGKEGSYGDAINWEALLANIPTGENLILVTGDADYLSKVSQDRLSEFLLAEWAKVKSSSVELHSTLTSFFGMHYPNIKLAAEVEKETAIRRLVSSENFNATHAAIAALSSYPDFSAEQAHALLQGALNNSQVYWIGQDDDIRDFFSPLYYEFSNTLSPDERTSFEEHFGLSLDL